MSGYRFVLRRAIVRSDRNVWTSLFDLHVGAVRVDFLALIKERDDPSA